MDGNYWNFWRKLTVICWKIQDNQHSKKNLQHIGKGPQPACMVLRICTRIDQIYENFQKILRFIDQNLYFLSKAFSFVRGGGDFPPVPPYPLPLSTENPQWFPCFTMLEIENSVKVRIWQPISSGSGFNAICVASINRRTSSATSKVLNQ